MSELGFVIEMRDNGDGRPEHAVAWLVFADGRRRRASAEEVALWEALREAIQQAKKRGR